MLKEYIWGTEDWLYQKDGLLIKEIDAHDKLSVQIHPDDEYAAAKGLERGKTECWFVKDAAEGAFVYCGFSERLSEAIRNHMTISPDEKVVREEILRWALDDGCIEEYLEKIYVKKGDFIFIPAGCVHAIGAGCRMLEVQQDSTTTYRFYDYKRVGADGKLRELHVDDAMACIRENEVFGKCELPFSCEYFEIKIEGNKFIAIRNGEKLFEAEI